jgi:flagellar protein FliL
MERVMKILGIATKVVTFLAVTAVALVSLASAYIIFAPETFPKPFHLYYWYPEQELAAQAASATGTPEPIIEPIKPGEGIMFNMSTKIINLADPAGRKYIRLTMVLEFEPDNPEYKKLKAEEQKTYLTEFESKVTARMPMMDDVVITQLSTKTFEDLYTAAGKEKLRQELIKAIASRVTELKLISIYFTEFVVQ